MSVTIGSQRLLTSGDRYYAYSGVVQGDVSVPASITLLSMDSGLKDSFVKIKAFYDILISGTAASTLGISVLIDGAEVYRTRQYYGGSQAIQPDGEETELFVPRQSTLEVVSLNTSGNNTQNRGCTLLGWYL